MFNFSLKFILFVNAIIALIFFYINDETYIGTLIYLSTTSAIAAIVINRINFIYQLRVVAISFIGIVPAYAIYDNGFFSKRLIETQTDQAAFLFCIIVCLSLFSSQLGFHFADKKKIEVKPLDLQRATKILFWIFLFLILIVGYLISLRRGELIFFNVYGTNRISLPINNLQSIAGILILWKFIIIARLSKLKLKTNSLNIFNNPYLIIFLFSLFYIVVWSQVFRGARMDPINILIGIFVLYFSFKGKIAKLDLKFFFILILFLLFFQFLGFARTQLSAGIGINEILSQLLKFRDASVGNTEVKYYFIGTFSDLSIGVAAIFAAIENNLVNFYYGKTYLDFILRIPPEFIYPDRPETLAFFTKDIFNETHGGGFNEMGEVYLNFGVYGSLFVPGIISYIIGTTYRKHLYNPFNIFASLPFIAILAVYLRFLLYQTFDGFKSYITALVLYVIIYCAYIFTKIISKRSK